ncbi:hypothetical protein K3759_13840 [Sulfitobacter sp. W027]|uniref:hypothetical protein n=1 Tax=Sulfitobacter sp. W027 TaxID=2867025 RepID=UPI0021A84D4D|nr:hypothetical protein [Sulfitobacter sp. W027]UWR33015.1 hypothetical protein K3759_13840 [Sulfitobacter sp. W027]
MKSDRNKLEGLTFLSDGTPMSLLRQNARALKKAKNLKLHEALDEIAKQYGFNSWSEMSAHKVHPIAENEILVGFRQEISGRDHEVYYDHLFVEAMAQGKEQVGSSVFIATGVEEVDGETLYVTNIHFISPERGADEDIREVRVQDVQALRALLDGGMTIRQTLAILDGLGVFDLYQRNGTELSSEA